MILVKSDPDFEERAEIETVGDAPDHELQRFVFHHFIRENKMSARQLQFAPDRDWNDAGSIRPVLLEMLAVLAQQRTEELN